MINKLSLIITEKLISDRLIDASKKELYSYGIFMLISHILFFLQTCVWGAVLKSFWESVFLYIFFQIIRRYAGGYHASTELRCVLFSNFLILVFLWIIVVLKTNNYQTYLFITTLFSSVCILFLCPIDTLEKPLNELEREHFRKISIIVLITILIIIALCSIIKLYVILYPACCSLILESILLVGGKIKNNKCVEQ